jgi:hypothetical protein
MNEALGMATGFEAHAVIDLDLGGVTSFRWRGNRLLDQQTIGLKQKLKTYHGFDRTPLVMDCLKTLLRLLPCGAGTAQHYLSKELQSFACATQHPLSAQADTQLRIDCKVRHANIIG